MLVVSEGGATGAVAEGVLTRFRKVQPRQWAFLTVSEVVRTAELGEQRRPQRVQRQVREKLKPCSQLHRVQRQGRRKPEQC